LEWTCEQTLLSGSSSDFEPDTEEVATMNVDDVDARQKGKKKNGGLDELM